MSKKVEVTGCEVNVNKEQTICEKVTAQLNYARKNGRSAETEKLILDNDLKDVNIPDLAVDYARDVIKGRWPEAEEMILRPNQYDGMLLAVEYARDVIKGRWPEAEEKMLRGEIHDILLSYVVWCVKGSWPEYEKMLTDNGDANNINEYNKCIMSKN